MEISRRAERIAVMREEGRWHGCVENIAMFGIAMLVFIVAFPVVAYVHEDAHQLEALAVFISLGLGILPALWYWRVRRHGWIASTLAGLFLTFSFTAALFHRWGNPGGRTCHRGARSRLRDRLPSAWLVLYTKPDQDT